MKLQIDDIIEFYTFSNNDKVLADYYSIQEMVDNPECFINLITLLKR
jgi:hypothetical protein